MKDFGIKPQVLEEIIAIAMRNDIDKVILFGSRARGNYRETSDIDIAVTGGDIARFALDVEEETNTLLEYDIVDLDMPVNEKLLESINSDGEVLYEKI